MYECMYVDVHPSCLPESGSPNNSLILLQRGRLKKEGMPQSLFVTWTNFSTELFRKTKISYVRLGAGQVRLGAGSAKPGMPCGNGRKKDSISCSFFDSESLSAVSFVYRLIFLPKRKFTHTFIHTYI